MHHHKTYRYINFQQNRVSRSVKTVHTNLFTKICKLHKFATCNYNFKKSRLSNMHYPFTDIQADFEINRLLDNKLPRKESISTDDRRTDGRHDRRTDAQTEDGQTSRTTTIGSFFEKRKNY